MAMVKLDLDLAYFRWRGNCYRQLKGFGMGKSTSSPLSDIFMEDFEAKVLFWLRKADDTLIAIHNDHIQPFHDYLNSIHSGIQWTREVEQDGWIAMLDVTIIRNPDGWLDFDVYRKPTHPHRVTDRKFVTNFSLVVLNCQIH